MSLALILTAVIGAQELPDLPDPLGLGGPIVGVTEGVLIVAGGANFPRPLAEGGAKSWHDEVYLLAPGATAWRAGGTLPEPRAYAACASTPLGVAVLGGSDQDRILRDAYLLTVTGMDDLEGAVGVLQYRPLPELPQPCAFGSAAYLDGSLYLLSGQTEAASLSYSNALWSLDLQGPLASWVGLPPIPGEARCKRVMAVQENRDGTPNLYAFSGSRAYHDAAGKILYQAFADGYRFDPGAQAWYPLADLPFLDDPRDLPGKDAFAKDPWPIAAGASLAAGKDRILTFGGTTDRYILDAAGELLPLDQRPDFLGRVLAYDIAADAWSEQPSMDLGVVTTTAVSWQGRAVIPSGETRPGIRTNKVQSYPLTDSAPKLFHHLDYLILGIYLALMVGVGIYFARRETSTEEFFLAGRRIPWWAAGLSIFGTQLSAITFMAIPATAYGSDWRRFAGQIMVLPVLLLVIRFFLPLFRKWNVVTAYEYLEIRFSLAVRLCASSLFILFQLGRMGIVLLLPAIALAAVTGMNPKTCILLMGALATVYTTLGGMSAVIWTDVVQVFVLVGGALTCLVVAVMDSGGVGAVMKVAGEADKFLIFDWTWSTTDMVGWILIVGFLFTNLVPYTTDQTIVQRYLTTPDIKQATRSLWLNFFMAVPTGLLFFGLGTALFVYYMQHPEQQSLLPDKPDQLVPWFVVTRLPVGIAGLVVAGIFAAAMSSLDSSMNSITTAVMNDFVKRLRGEGTPSRQMRLARSLTVVLGVIGTGTALLLATQEIRYLFDFFQKIMGLFGGGLAGVFLLAVFTRRTHATGALIGLLSGGAMTLVAAFFTDVHFLLYAVIGVCVCVVVGYLVSLVGGGSLQDTLDTAASPPSQG
ncbi:MAG: sodium:solute symporter family transporter [Planctomycetota bacterium]